MRRRLRRILSSAILFLVALAGTSAQQAGYEVVVSSTSEGRWVPSSGALSATQGFRGSFGGTSFIGERALFRVLGFAEYSPAPDSFLEGSYLFDLEQLYLDLEQDGVFSGRAVYRFGRYSFSDRSRRVVVHPADGFRMRGDFGSAVFRLDAAYTGLVLRPSSRIALTESDAELLSLSDDEGAVFGPGRLLTRTGYGLRAASGVESGVEITTQWDLPNVASPESIDGSSRYHSAYLNVYTERPLGDRYVLNASTVLGAGLTLPRPGFSSIDLSLLLQALLEYYPGDRNRNVLTLGLVSASSEAVGLRDFRPVTPLILGRVESVSAAGHAQVSTSWSTRPFLTGPFSGFQVILDSRGIFRLNATQESELADSDTGSLYLGFDSGLSVRYRPVSDLSLSAAAFAFVPGAESSVESAVMSGRVQVAMTF